MLARHSLDFWLTSEDLPEAENRLSLDRQGNNDKGHQRLIARLKHLMQQQTRCTVHGQACHEGLLPRSLFIGQRLTLTGVAHQNGTIRFGHDPRTSALDVHCTAHEVDNLYVVDASFFPPSGAVHPALTILANALRVGDHLQQRLP